MAQHIIDTALTETFYLDAHDEMIVTQSGSITVDGSAYGITNRFMYDSGMRIEVDGLVQGGTGIALNNDEFIISDERTYIDIGETGLVSGVSVSQGFGVDVRVAGAVMGDAGINLSVPDITLEILGEIRTSNVDAVKLSRPYFSIIDGGLTVFNAGTIHSDGGFGVSVYEGAGEFRNTGLVSGASGIFASDASGLLIKNEGTILASIGDGIRTGPGNSTDGESVKIKNSGLIDANEAAILAFETGAHIVNSGTLSGKFGIVFGRFGGDAELFLRNTGVIVGEKFAIKEGGEGHWDIVNKGRIEGDVGSHGGRSDYHLINRGLIDGDIQFGYYDDFYKIDQNGTTMGTVKGYFGNDTLIGNDDADWLEGNGDDDILRGRGGEDILSGGKGADQIYGGIGADQIDGGADRDDLYGKLGKDTIHGGSGQDKIDGGQSNDTLYGDGGADVFVFGEKSGTDSVMDFVDGKDVLRTIGHTGGFADLTFSDVDGNLEIEHDNGTIVLVGQAGLVLTQADFEFF